jgi:hypothetical protein
LGTRTIRTRDAGSVLVAIRAAIRVRGSTRARARILMLRVKITRAGREAHPTRRAMEVPMVARGRADRIGLLEIAAAVQIAEAEVVAENENGGEG